LALARWIVAAALFVVACSSPEERLANHLERGEVYLEEGRPDEALLEFQSALNLLPDDANLNERVGRVLYQLGRFEEALRHFVHAQQLDPTRVEAAMFEARIIVRRNPARAKQLVKAALDEDPDRDAVQRASTLIALTEGDTVTALKAAQRAAKLNAEEPENWLALGSVYQSRIHDRQRRQRPPKDEIFSSALAAFGRVEELEPGDPRSVVLQARVYAAWPGHEADALAAFDRALEIARPSGRSADVALVAQALDDYAKLLERPELRVRALRELIGVQPANYDAWESLARQAGVDDPLQSEGVYLELLEQNPQDPRAHLIYANYLLRTDRGKDAEGHVRHVLSEEMDEAGLWDWLVRTELRRGRPARARAAYVELSERHKGSFEARSAAVRLALGEGRPEEATRLLVPLIKEAETAELQRLRALAAYRVGNLPAAGTAIAKCIALSPQPSVAALRLRARIGHDAKSWPQVLDSYERLERMGSELTGEDQVHLATALYQSGEEELGLAKLQELLKQTPPAPGAALAYAELRGGPDPEGARQALLASLAASPNDADLVTALTRLDVAAGHVQAALERLNTVVSGGGATPAVLQLRAEVLAGLGAYDEAEADLLRAFEANPGRGGCAAPRREAPAGPPLPGRESPRPRPGHARAGRGRSSRAVGRSQRSRLGARGPRRRPRPCADPRARGAAQLRQPPRHLRHHWLGAPEGGTLPGRPRRVHTGHPPGRAAGRGAAARLSISSRPRARGTGPPGGSGPCLREGAGPRRLPGG
jgi:tetratricopeptide (TPR) repeat protein